MTEADWFGSADPDRMLESLAGRASDRKLYLFGSACCRRIWHLLADGRSREAVERTERFADGTATAEGLAPFLLAAADAVRASPPPRDAAEAACFALAVGDWGVLGAAWAAADAAAHAAAAFPAEKGEGSDGFSASLLGAERASQCDLIRCLLGNPFRRVRVAPTEPTWPGGAAVELARAVYEERELPSGHLDAARLAVLADLLEKAGGTDPQLLGHLRSPGPHVRGCFAVDAVLDRVCRDGIKLRCFSGNQTGRAG